MSIPTTPEILNLLDHLETQVADDLETPWVDFKPWSGPKDAMGVAVEYAACFANANGGVEVSRYLKAWSRPDGFLRREGKPPTVRYFPKSETEAERKPGL